MTTAFTKAIIVLQLVAIRLPVTSRFTVQYSIILSGIITEKLHGYMCNLQMYSTLPTRLNLEKRDPILTSNFPALKKCNSTCG